MKPFLSALASLFIATAANAAVVEATPAKNFTAHDEITGKDFSLSDFKGKTVVLEWTNYECPFVKKHYGAGNMQKLQEAATKDGVVWVSINSSAAGKEGHLADATAVKAGIAQRNATPAHFVRDVEGKIGHLYGAKTTPHIFIINAAGELAYQGAIDSVPSADPADIATATNYVTQTLAELKAGKAVSTPVTQPYGCSVKY